MGQDMSMVPATPSADEFKQLIMAISNKNVELVQTLLESESGYILVNEQALDGSTPHIYACCEDDQVLVCVSWSRVS